MLLAAPPSRPLRHVGGRVFLWHQRHADLGHLRQLGQADGLVVVLATDASGETGWGIAYGNSWVQGVWCSDDLKRSINWKELKVYHLALERLHDVLKNKLVFLKMDNTCAIHYVNAGTGRIADLNDLARSIRLAEGRLGVESVAVHIPGERNVTADALSRMLVSADLRDKHTDKTLRKRLFKQILERMPELTIDGMCADDGHNAQLERYVGPSDSVFELDFDTEVIWCFPPEDLIGATLKFLSLRRRAKLPVHVVLCVPERTSAPWFFHLASYRRVMRFVRGSDLFRERTMDGLWKKLPPVREPWVIVASW